MKILIVASFNKGFFAPFILEQSEALEKMGQTVHFFGIQGHGIWGYVRNYKGLKRIIQDYKPDVIHAHYGLSGLLSVLQRRVPVVTTFHGSDINNRKVLPFSRLAMKLSAFTIFVSQKNVDIARPTEKFALLPCGVNSANFSFVSKQDILSKLQKYGIHVRNGVAEVEIWGTGKPMREFLWSEDMARACVYAMEHINFEDVKKLSVPTGSSEIRNCHINIGTGKEISINDLAHLVAKIIGFKGNVVFNEDKPDGTMRKLTDPSKLHALGWKHTIEIEEGINLLYNWYLN